MQTVVHIDRSTFKANPDAGRTHWVEPGPIQRVRHSCKRDGDWYVEKVEQAVGDGWVTVAETNYGGGLPRAEYERISEHREVMDFHTMFPAPDWLYEYLPTQVTCDGCGKTFLHTQLKSDDFVDGDGDDYTVDDICPKCGEPDCCDLVYEKPEAVARELGLI